MRHATHTSSIATAISSQVGLIYLISHNARQPQRRPLGMRPGHKAEVRSTPYFT
ncbi:MAG: hypothetical protein M3Y86_09790 [Verrucomicrobiota bacterium]|nr:hypothetical protein [Verrucomicrobiota bacterium]